MKCTLTGIYATFLQKILGPLIALAPENGITDFVDRSVKDPWFLRPKMHII
jgi:hypothetical protein